MDTGCILTVAEIFRLVCMNNNNIIIYINKTIKNLIIIWVDMHSKIIDLELGISPSGIYSSILEF